jgi:D-sedoheptulose 7-phosphate isomerase
MSDETPGFRAELQRLEKVAAATREAAEPEFLRLVGESVAALRGGGKLLLFGNGGSAAEAQHIAAELAVRYRHDRRALPALALTADTAVLTAAGNDLGYDEIFARQVEALGRPGDLALALTTSGRSANVIRGLDAARRLGLCAAALSGGDGGALHGLADPLVLVPSFETARIQEMHLALGHVLCAAIERALDLA